MSVSVQITHHSAHERINIVTLGQVGHGKTTLLSALTRVLAQANNANRYLTVEQIEDISEVRGFGVSVPCTEVTYTLGERHYLHLDYPSHADSLKGMITGRHRMHGAILVVSALDGLQPQTQEQIHLALQAKVPALLVFINEMDQGDDQELLDVVELEIRELLVRYELARTDIPIIRGSALQALESKGNLSRLDPAAQCIWELLETMDTCIPGSLPAGAKPFLMQIEDVFNLKKRGLAAVGYIERGMLRAGSHVEIVGMEQESRTILVTGIANSP